jgi:signal peptidase II
MEDRTDTRPDPAMFILMLCIFVTFSDQLTKFLVRASFALSESRTVIPGLFDLTYVRNTGAAFGMLSQSGVWLAVLSVVMLGVIIVFRRAFLTDGLISRLAMALMISGILGNLIDRLRLGYVVDFLDFHCGAHRFPAFNLADSAICTGVGLYVLSQFLASKAGDNPEACQASAEAAGSA